MYITYMGGASGAAKTGENKMFAINQIVKGKRAGTFVVLGFRNVGGEKYAQLKSVNPADHSQMAAGELALPLDAIEALH